LGGVEWGCGRRYGKAFATAEQAWWAKGKWKKTRRNRKEIQYNQGRTQLSRGAIRDGGAGERGERVRITGKKLRKYT